MLKPLQGLSAFAAGAAAGFAAGATIGATLGATVGAGAGLGASALARRRGSSNLAVELSRALTDNAFEMRYQPIVDLSDRRCIGAEALIRLRNHSGALIGPDAFIPLAEHSGLMLPITERVIELVGADMIGLLRRRPDLHVGINLPPSILTAGALRSAAERSGLYPLSAQVIIEITETGTVGAAGREAVATARSLGVGVAIDDFGTGANDLAQLQDLRVDFIKIDHSFVGKIGSQAPGARLIEAIVTIARDVHARTIAEGVETEAQADYLRDIGVDYGQGFLFAHPLTPREFEAYLGGAGSAAPAPAGTA